MAGLIRQGHFLGAKLRNLRKRNGLTLDELSARCVQIDAAGAPSVSYLSMVDVLVDQVMTGPPAMRG